MKKCIVLIITLMFAVIGVQAQSFKAPSTTAKSSITTDSTTTFTYEVKGVEYKVFRGARGGFYYWAPNSKGVLTKYYVPKEVKAKMQEAYAKQHGKPATKKEK